METTTVYALKYKGALVEIAEDKAKKILAANPDSIQSWEFQHTDYTGDASISVGAKMADARVGTAFGSDAETIAVARGKFIAQEIVTVPANPGTLPPIALKLFGRVMVGNVFPTDEELSALMEPTKASSESTTTVEA